MEAEDSLPHLQVPATCPYPEPVRSSPNPHIPIPGDSSQYYPPIHAWVFQVVSFPQVSPPKHCIHLSSPPYALHAPPTSHSSRFYHPNNTGWEVPYVKLIVHKLRAPSCQGEYVLFRGITYLWLLCVGLPSYRQFDEGYCELDDRSLENACSPLLNIYVSAFK